VLSQILPSASEVRSRIESIKDEKYRNAFKYQYLIAGRISEVCGKYAPLGSEAYETEFDVNGDKVPAVIFAVKTAKRKGMIRPIAVPLELKYEPWSRPVFEYFQDYIDSHPFQFHERWSVRYAQWEAEKVFEGLRWRLKEYWNSKTGLKVPEREKQFTSHCLRKLRIFTLEIHYRFDTVDLAKYGGWKERTIDPRTPAGIDHYLHMRPRKENLDILKFISGRYFEKLLKPFEKLTSY